MNKEKLNELRSKITIPLAEAVNLLKQHDEDIEQCIQAFHAENIRRICEQTACEQNIVCEYYHNAVYGYDLEKVLSKVSAYMRKPIRLTIEENPVELEKVGFFIWAEDEDLNEIVDDRNRMYFIPSDDFSYVINIFRSVYPILDPCSKALENYFDVCFYNYFDQNTIQIIISKIKALNFTETKIMCFLVKIIECLEEKSSIGTYVIV